MVKKKPVQVKSHSLPCPVCKVENPVSRANLKVKCGGCGAKLLSIRVVKKVK